MKNPNHCPSGEKKGGLRSAGPGDTAPEMGSASASSSLLEYKRLPDRNTIIEPSGDSTGTSCIRATGILTSSLRTRTSGGDAFDRSSRPVASPTSNAMSPRAMGREERWEARIDSTRGTSRTRASSMRPSPMSRSRSRGSLFRQRLTKALAPRGSGSQSGSARTTAARTSVTLSPSKGFRRVSAS